MSAAPFFSDSPPSKSSIQRQLLVTVNLAGDPRPSFSFPSVAKPVVPIMLAVKQDARLAVLGHRPELGRNLSAASILGLAFAVLNSWTALSASLPVSLTSGGSTSIVWDLVMAAVCNLCIAASLAEFLSAYPTAGGQYHWPDPVARKPWVPILSWITNWINVAGWVAFVATNALLSSQLIVGILSLLPPMAPVPHSHRPGPTVVRRQRLPQFVSAVHLPWSLNLVHRRLSSGQHHCTCLRLARIQFRLLRLWTVHQPNRLTRWHRLVAGALARGLGLTAFDSVAHMIEEIPNAAVEGPRIMVSCVGIRTVTGAGFLIVLLLVSGNIHDVINSSAGPLLHILYHATKSYVGAVCLLMIPLLCLVFATLSVTTTSSCMIFAFARDGGLPASRLLAQVHPQLGLPLNALALTLAIVVLFGLIFLASTSAFNAIISASVVALDLSYAVPIATKCLQRRGALPAARAWKLPGWFGWAADTVSLLYISLTTVLFLFPPERSVSGTNMNYCIAAFAIIVIISAFQWCVDGRKNFTEPRLDLGGGQANASDVHFKAQGRSL